METSKKTVIQVEDKYTVRFPDGLRDRIAEAAKTNNRSMNAEIVARLQESFEPRTMTLVGRGSLEEANQLADAIAERLRSFANVSASRIGRKK